MHFVLAFTSKMFCSFGPHRYRVAPGMASGVCVCVLRLFHLAGDWHHAVTVFTLS